MSNLVTKQSFVISLPRIAAALEKNLSGKTVVLEGKVWAVKDLVTEIQRVIALLAATDASHKAWLKGVADDKAAHDELAPTISALRSFIAATYGTSSSVYTTDFGFPVRKQGKPSAATVTQSIAKRAATRKARNTMGKKQRLKVKGVVQPATSEPAAASPTGASSASATTSSGGSGNGPNGQSH